MSALLDVSYVLLCAAVLIESAILRTLVRDTLWIARLFDAEEFHREASGPRIGSRAPAFRARVAGSLSSISEGELRGRSSMLCFIDADAAARTPHLSFQAMIEGLRSKIDGDLLIVCKGAEGKCQSLRDRHPSLRNPDERVKLLVDDAGAVGALFNAPAAPSAVMLDAEGYVLKVGQARH